MLTPELSERFKILFAPIDSLPGGYFSEDELDGFMHALVIIPDPIKPSEWLPAPFYGDISIFDDAELATPLAEFLLECYEYYCVMRNKGELKYTYDLKDLNEGIFNTIYGWARGFWYGLSLRMSLWKSPYVTKKDAKTDPVVVSMEVFRGLGDDTFDTAPMLKKIKKNSKEDIADEEWESRLIVNLMDAIPVSLHTLQEFSRYMIEKKTKELTLAEEVDSSNKVGRNEDCPCGSGKKSKLCCALEN